MSLADKTINFQINQKGDYLSSRALKFLEDYTFNDFSKSQINGLSKVVGKSKNFDEMKNEVTSWINKQAGKKNDKNWEKVRESLHEMLFEWGNNVEEIKTISKKNINNIIIENEINSILNEENIRNNLEAIKYQLAKRVYYILITLHRCYNIKDNDEKIEKLITNISEEISNENIR